MIFDPARINEIADEYILGLLEQSDQNAVEAEMERNAALLKAVAVSRERFLPLDATAEPVRVSTELWNRIERGIENAEPALPRGGLAPAPKLAVPSGANDNTRFSWRTTTIASLAASLVLAIALAWSLGRQVDPIVIAVLVNERGAVQAVLEDYGNENARIRLLADLTVPENKAIEVWTLPSRDVGPVSLGLLERSNSSILKAPPLPQPKDAQLYEITLEQAGGSPSGRPTGPILAKGFAKLPR